MKVLHIVGRIGLAVPFVVLGYVTAAAPGDRVRAAERLGLPQPELIVRANGAAMVTGGTALALGIVPRAAATGLVASLLPTTVAGHPFWETADPAVRDARKIQFLKNVGLIGALLVYLARDDH
ncbi:MAG TPA: DoxX family protein [Ruania sp.]|nr:DoxX family protein [Ruania sp.]